MLKIPLIVYLQSTTDYLAEEWGGRHRGPFGTGIPQSEADHLRAMRDDRIFDLVREMKAETGIEPVNIQKYMEKGKPWPQLVIEMVDAFLGILLMPVVIITTAISGVIARIPLIGFLYVFTLAVIWVGILDLPIRIFRWVWWKTPRYFEPLWAIPGIIFAIIGLRFLRITGRIDPSVQGFFLHEDRINFCMYWPALSDEYAIRMVIDHYRKRR